MSTVALDGEPYLFSQEGEFDAPYTFTVPATLEVRTDAASAGFDGSGAAGAFLPALSFYSPSGVHIGTFPIQADPIPMGGSCEVSWSPFVPVASSAAPAGGGIQFDTFPQAGDWLYVETDNEAGGGGSPSGWGIELNSQDTGGIWIHADNHSVLVTAGQSVAIDATQSLSFAANTGFTFSGSPFDITLNGQNTLTWTPLLGPFTGFDLETNSTSFWMRPGETRLATKTGAAANLIFSSNDAQVEIISKQELSLESAGDPLSAILAGVNASGSHQLLGYSMIGQGGVYGTFPVAGHFFMLEGGTLDSYDSYFEIRDQFSGAAVLRVVRANSGGAISYHIQTGGTWVADL